MNRTRVMKTVLALIIRISKRILSFWNQYLLSLVLYMMSISLNPSPITLSYLITQLISKKRITLENNQT